jgi:metallo-beta-lactamase family protein
MLTASELFQWMSGFKEKPKITFTVHGEGNDLHLYAQAIREKFGWNVTVPQYLESVQLFRGI